MIPYYDYNEGRRSLWSWFCAKALFPLFCRYVAPQLLYMRGSKMEGKATFKWQKRFIRQPGKKVTPCNYPSTEVMYRKPDGVRGRLRIELIPSGRK